MYDGSEEPKWKNALFDSHFIEEGGQKTKRRKYPPVVWLIFQRSKYSSMYLESSWVEDQPSIILEGETWTNRLKFQYEVLGWPQRLFRFFHNILHKNPNELCGQHSISLSVRQSFNYNNKPPPLGNDRPVRQGCFVPRTDQSEAGWQLPEFLQRIYFLDGSLDWV